MSSLGDQAFTGHPVHAGSQDTNFNFASASDLPDSYTWPTLGLSIQGEVPVIDLASPDVVAKLGHACREWGIFQLQNHGVPVRLLDDVESESRRLFSLPVEQKLKAARLPEGAAGYGTARISSFFSKKMWSEGFTILGSPLEHAQQLWPDDHSRFCEVIDEYQKEMKQLVSRLMLLILESLEVSKDGIAWCGPAGDFADTSTAALQLNFYPACPNPDQAMGLAEHTDSALLTILHQSNTAGLQVLDGESGKWVTVPALPDALVINVGDLLHILSNGRYKTALHRAVVNRSKPRLSVAYLWGPPSNVQLSPLSELVGPEEEPLYRPVTWPEYLKIKAIHFNMALSSIKHTTDQNHS